MGIREHTYCCFTYMDFLTLGSGAIGITNILKNIKHQKIKGALNMIIHMG